MSEKKPAKAAKGNEAGAKKAAIDDDEAEKKVQAPAPAQTDVAAKAADKKTKEAIESAMASNEKAGTILVQQVEAAEQAVPEAKAAETMASPVVTENEKYLNSGAHIGTKFKSGDMRRYIYKVRKDGLKVLDVQTLDDKLKAAAKFLARYPREKVAVVSRRAYGQTPVKMFAETVGGIAITARFVPGTFTNPESTHYAEPAVVLVVDPEVDNQAIEEATRIRIPVIGMASTNNSLKDIDLVIPINNKGKKSLALGFWVLAKEILKHRGEIKEGSEFKKTPDDFEYKLKEGEEEEQRRSFERRQMRGKDGGRDRRGGRDGGREGGGFRRFGSGGSDSRGGFGRRRFD